MEPSIHLATMSDQSAVVGLMQDLWPENDLATNSEDFTAAFTDDEQAFFLARIEGLPIGFAQASLRRDYVEGSNSSPVGYLEGIYVVEKYRSKNVARALCKRCESWAVEKGCTEFGSDCELSNTVSIAFHKHTGFTEANRIVCFIKELS